MSGNLELFCWGWWMLAFNNKWQPFTHNTSWMISLIKMHLLLIRVRICKMFARYLVLFTLASLSPLPSYLSVSLSHSCSQTCMFSPSLALSLSAVNKRLNECSKNTHWSPEDNCFSFVYCAWVFSLSLLSSPLIFFSFSLCTIIKIPLFSKKFYKKQLNCLFCVFFMLLSLAHCHILGRMRKEKKRKKWRQKLTLNVLGKDRKIHFIACLFSSCCPFTNLSSIATHLLSSLSFQKRSAQSHLVSRVWTSSNVLKLELYSFVALLIILIDTMHYA